MRFPAARKIARFFAFPSLSPAARRRRLLYLGLAVAGAGVVLLLYLIREKTLEELRRLAAETAMRHGLDPAVVDAVVRAESRYDPEAVSRARAYGLMQLQVPTATEVARRPVSADDLFDPVLNLDLGCRYLKRLLTAYGGDLRLALMAYNAGPGRVERWMQREADPARILATLAFPETRAYVEKVLRYAEDYRLRRG